MTPRTKEQNEQIRLRRMKQILKAAADVYLDKNMLMEIRDVAAAAGLGYGTVYHYYNNKSDLLYDLLLQGLERAADIWLAEPVAVTGRREVIGNGGSLGPVPSTAVAQARTVSASPSAPVSGAARDRNGNGHGNGLASLAVRLLQAWAEDRAFYLACLLGADHYRQLPAGQAELLASAYRKQVLLPLAGSLTLGGSGGESEAADVPRAGPEALERRAEWLLAGLTGCALPSLRRGTLRKEAGEIVRFLFI
ncbi:TetR family transcriptional regulator [Paenibacillus sp. DYY-L-2]|uniref:TetR family transcriptional regulator n=1 Tax=Paenibacillus sp. DYY-L-2 TaxID=3447013 RepID=UPI003F4FC2CD